MPTVHGSMSRGGLREDVALFARAVSPFNQRRFVTICNGMYGRGTYGAVRALTDERFRDRNAEYLRETFGDSDAFCILSRVTVENGRALTPDWTMPETRLFEWSSPQRWPAPRRRITMETTGACSGSRMGQRRRRRSMPSSCPLSARWNSWRKQPAPPFPGLPVGHLAQPGQVQRHVRPLTTLVRVAGPDRDRRARAGSAPASRTGDITAAGRHHLRAADRCEHQAQPCAGAQPHAPLEACGLPG